ncbi:MAG: type II toxin-antitoxin system RnlB family antitoxin [Acholeplasmataceae bacterium]|nr:type II toxin-antitoxin system RnlB family antitoxin [Acholeplasmataceae bacterium]
MQKYTALKKSNDVILIALNSIYDFSAIVAEIEKDILINSFNGYLVFDCLLSCVSNEAVDRFAGYKVQNGLIIRGEKLLFVPVNHDFVNLGDEYYKKLDKKIINNSLLSAYSKAKYSVTK